MKNGRTNERQNEGCGRGNFGKKQSCFPDKWFLPTQPSLARFCFTTFFLSPGRKGGRKLLEDKVVALALVKWGEGTVGRNIMPSVDSLQFQLGHAILSFFLFPFQNHPGHRPWFSFLFDRRRRGQAGTILEWGPGEACGLCPFFVRLFSFIIPTQARCFTVRGFLGLRESAPTRGGHHYYWRMLALEFLGTPTHHGGIFFNQVLDSAYTPPGGGNSPVIHSVT